jgi:hypothetical protein
MIRAPSEGSFENELARFRKVFGCLVENEDEASIANAPLR